MHKALKEKVFHPPEQPHSTKLLHMLFWTLSSSPSTSDLHQTAHFSSLGGNMTLQEGKEDWQ